MAGKVHKIVNHKFNWGRNSLDLIFFQCKSLPLTNSLWFIWKGCKMSSFVWKDADEIEKCLNRLCQKVLVKFWPNIPSRHWHRGNDWRHFWSPHADIFKDIWKIFEIYWRFWEERDEVLYTHLNICWLGMTAAGDDWKQSLRLSVKKYFYSFFKMTNEFKFFIFFQKWGLRMVEGL